VHKPSRQKDGHHCRNAPGLMEVLRVVVSRWLEQNELRRPGCCPHKGIQVKREAGFVGNGGQMEGGVGRAPDSHIHSEGILECLRC